MDSLTASSRMKQQYLSNIPDPKKTAIKSVLARSDKYEKLYGVPLHHFSEDQYQAFLQIWLRKSSFFIGRNRVSKYLEWLELEGIPTTLASLRNVKYSTEQIIGIAKPMFHTIADLQNLIYRLYFSGEGLYSSTVQEGTVLLLRTLGLNNAEIAVLQVDDIDFQARELAIGDSRVICDIPESFLEMFHACAQLKGRYVRENSSSKTVELAQSPYLIKAISEDTTRNAVFIANLIKRSTRIWKESNLTADFERELSTKDLSRTYVFCKFLRFELDHPDQTLASTLDESVKTAELLAAKWSGIKLSNPTSIRYFLEEYICWKKFACRE